MTQIRLKRYKTISKSIMLRESQITSKLMKVTRKYRRNIILQKNLSKNKTKFNKLK